MDDANRFRMMSIDPASHVTGWAMWTVAHNFTAYTVTHAGYVGREGRKKTPMADRVRLMIDELNDLPLLVAMNMIIIEVPDGKVHGRIRDQSPAGLSVYGFAAGGIWAAMELLARDPSRVITVGQNQWTRGQPKKKRQAAIAAEFPQYAQQMGIDKGADIADAIGVGLWWINETFMQAATGAIEREADKRNQ